jgi:RNA polymerase sigma-70 factor (ECF subfamily)
MVDELQSAEPPFARRVAILNPIQTTSAIAVQKLLDQLKSGNQDASRQLLDVTMERLRNLSRKILADHPSVQRWEEIDDLVQNSSLRLWMALEKHHPPTPLDYFRLAAAVIRRELIDLTRRYFGPMGLGANQAKSWNQDGSHGAAPVDLMPDSTYDPVKLGNWSEFHAYIENLPEEEQTLFDLLWYQGLTLDDAAEAIGSSERTVRRRWRAARVALYAALMAEEADHNQ